jgi:hypothetical protein
MLWFCLVVLLFFIFSSQLRNQLFITTLSISKALVRDLIHKSNRDQILMQVHFSQCLISHRHQLFEGFPRHIG